MPRGDARARGGHSRLPFDAHEGLAGPPQGAHRRTSCAFSDGRKSSRTACRVSRLCFALSSRTAACSVHCSCQRAGCRMMSPPSDSCAAADMPRSCCSMADTNVHYFNDTFMIFATHDASVNNTGFIMNDCALSEAPPQLAAGQLPAAGCSRSALALVPWLTEVVAVAGWVWSSPDLVDWTLESVVSPKVSLKW